MASRTSEQVMQGILERQRLLVKEHQEYQELMTQHEARLCALQEAVDELLLYAPIPWEHSPAIPKPSKDQSSQDEAACGREVGLLVKDPKSVPDTPSTPPPKVATACDTAVATPVTAASGGAAVQYSVRFVEVSEELLEEESSWGERRSCWDAVAFLGHRAVMSSSESAYLVLLAVLTVVLQVGFLQVISRSLTVPEIDEEEVEAFTLWRVMAAHRADLVDALSLESLASRVCRQDPSLHLSQKQVESLGQIERYLYNHKPFNGPLLCTLAMLAWLLVVFRELQCLFDRLRLLWYVPRRSSRVATVCSSTSRADDDATSSTKMCPELRLLDVGCRRALWMLGLVLMRIAIAVNLMAAGLEFLCYTLSLPELIMNAVALEFVLKLDEIVFTSLSTVRMRSFLRLLKLARLPPRQKLLGLDAQSVVALATLLLVLAAYFCFFLLGHIDLLTRARDALCEGNLHFGFTVTEGGFPVWAPLNVDAASYREVFATTRYKVLQEVVTSETGGIAEKYQMLEFQGSEWSLASIARWDVAELASVFNPNCDDHLTPATLELDLPVFWYHLATVRDATSNQSVTLCSDVELHCHDASTLGTFIRLACPASCGCRSPGSGLVLGTPDFGCSETCAVHPDYRQGLLQAPCYEARGQELQNSSAWQEWIRQIQDTTTAWPNRNMLVEMTDEMAQHGCNVVHFMFTVYNWNLCLMTAFRPITLLCPITCGCTGEGALPRNQVAEECPAQCAVAGPS